MEGAAHLADGFTPSALIRRLKASLVRRDKSQGAPSHFETVSGSWLGTVGIFVVVGIAYFLAARLGLVLRALPGVSIFWPAAGIAVGAFITFGAKGRLPVAAAVTVATIASGMLISRRPSIVITFAVFNVAEALLTTWLIEHWFGRPFRLEAVPQVLGFLVASAVGAAITAAGAAVTVNVLEPAMFPAHVWRIWFASCSLGIITVAPLVIGLGEIVRERPPRRELIEGTVGLALLAALSVFLISLPQRPWATALPVAVVLPVLLWIAVRCRPVFAAAAMFVVALVVIWSTTFDLGNLEDASVPVAVRILAAQTLVLAAALLALVLAALFADRRRGEAALERSKERLQLALDGAELGAFSADLITGHLECDARAARVNGHSVAPTTIKASRRYIHRDDLMRIDSAIAEAARSGGVWNAEYRVKHPPDHPHAGETHWVAVESSIVRNGHGTAVGLLGVTRDITRQKQAAKALAEREMQRALAGRAGLVGSYAYCTDDEIMQVSPGYAAIHGFPEGTEDITRAEWLAGVHPEDAKRLDALRNQVIGQRRAEYNIDYRVVRPGGEVRWIESRSFIFYRGDGHAQRFFGVNIDVTERKQAEALLNDSKARLANAMAAGQVMTFEWDAVTGLSERCALAAQILGFERGCTTGGNHFLRHVHADDRAKLKARLDELIPDHPSYTLSFRFIRPDGKQVWLEETAKGEFDPAGRLLRIKGLTRDITERKQAELALAERTLQLALAERAALVGSVTYDIEAEKMQISAGYAAIYGFPERTSEITRSEWLSRVHVEDVGRLEGLRSCAIRKRANEYSADFRIVRAAGEIRWIEARSFVSYGGDGRPQRVVGVNIDVTERKRAEDHQRALNAELDHRVKNVLATVSAIITQTAEGYGSHADFIARLGHRISSLARTHELLSQSNWRGVTLAELARREFAPFASGNADLGGPAITLKAEATQAVAMVLHELTTNAAKYGAFSDPNGHVSLRWWWLQNGSNDRLAIDWQEIGGPPVRAPRQFGYGTSIIRELIPFELGGAADLAFAADGIRCRLEIPDDWVRSGSRSTEPPKRSAAIRSCDR